MNKLEHLFEGNRRWASSMNHARPSFFETLSAQQSPEYLWIGCSDSRVPANEIVGLDPGELFVHRNVANVVAPDDLNCLSVLQYAVDVLRVKHVIVCGHYGCGGVRAALDNKPLGLIDDWLRGIRDIADHFRDELNKIAEPVARQNRLCELNVAKQLLNVCQTSIVQDVWARGQELSVHGWIYGLHDGLLQDLGLSVSSSNHPPKS